MEEELTKIKKIFSKIKFKKLTYERKEIRPSRDWYRILTSTMTLIFLSALAAYYFYIEVDHGWLFPSSEKIQTKIVSINNGLLNKIIKEMDDNRKNLDEFKQNKIIPPDPSL